ncbi:MAG: epimerase [Micrococcales bacterium]|nr:MAG: epimerase [Micrococcales bacterium]PIE25928.1 MAG: epimerase [Micrococcales bacterium]
MARNVLVTGVSRYLGGRFARTVAKQRGIGRVIGVDVVAPAHDIGKATFFRVDLRSPVEVRRLLADADIDTVVHMGVISTSPPGAGRGARAAMKEINVIGSMQMLAACQGSEQVRRLVLKSTAGVYGGSAVDPAMFTEDIEPAVPPSSGWAKDTVDVEGYARALARRRPDLNLTVLRFANIVGPGMHTPLTDVFELPVVPVVAGFDPRIQLVHEDDAIGATLAAVRSEASGVVNIAGDNVIALLQMVAMAGRPPLMVPQQLTAWADRVIKRLTGVEIGAEEWSLLQYGRGLDTTRMRDMLGYECSYDTKEAFEDYLTSRQQRGWHASDSVSYVDSALRAGFASIGLPVPEGASARPGSPAGPGRGHSSRPRDASRRRTKEGTS